MKKILIIILMSVFAGTAVAQSAQDAPKTPQQQAQQSAKAKTARDKEKTAQENKDQKVNPAADVSDTFVPSEKISEDLSVAFPVDM